ncbi:hypothetical protein D3C72_1240520 [compost metagenome]
MPKFPKNSPTFLGRAAPPEIMNFKLPPVFSFILLKTNFSASVAFTDNGNPTELPASLF